MAHPLARQIAHANGNGPVEYDVDTLEQLLDAVITLTKERCIQKILSGELGFLLVPEAQAIESLNVK